MYNSDTPARAELPSSKQLLRSTLIAAVAAVVLLVTVVLPAEYGIDPTGLGRVLGLTEMGQTKVQLAAEAAADEGANAPSGAAAPATATPGVPTAPAPAPVENAANGVAPPAPAPAPAAAAWQDEERFRLAPGQGLEIKLVMKEGAKAEYAWEVSGGVVNYDTHGDGGGRSISYEKGRGVPGDEGVLTAAFTGNHGWFWRNRGKAPVDVVVRTRGDYAELKRVP